LPKSQIGSRRWRRPSARMPIASKRRWIPSSANRLRQPAELSLSVGFDELRTTLERALARAVDARELATFQSQK
jgi:hypothetical protein